jgi:hypothetical protein
MQRSFNVLMLLAAACSGPPYFWSDEYAQTYPKTADLVASSLTQGCPVEGAPAGHLRKSLGRPKIHHAADSASSRWRFKLDDSSTLHMTVKNDTIVQWDVLGRPSSRIAQSNYSWSINQSKTFPRRLLEYLNAHPDIEPRHAFLLLRGCPALGVSREAIQASWGPPSRIEAGRDTTRLIYGFGVEGQHDIILLVSDTVRGFRSVHWHPGE